MLLHGLGATATLNWSSSLAVLASRYNVVAPDLRGHGRGVRASAPFSLEDAADDVAALADALGLERFIPVGYSMGGPIAQLIWRRHRDRVDGLVLCATAYRFCAALREQLMFAPLPILECASRLAPPQLQGALRYPRTVFQAATALARYSAEPWIRTIDVPTSVVVHTRDQLVPPSRQLELAATITGARMYFVDVDHFAVVRRPLPFVDALVDAIDGVVSEATAPACRAA